jgi:hypothetical protein
MLGTIGLFLRSNDNDYQQRLKEVGLREAKKQGFEIVIESAQNDASRQVEQIHAAIKNASTTKLAAILVSTVRDDVLPELVREAAEAGIDWALLNEGMFIDEIRAQYPSRAIFVVTPDQLEIGRIHGRQVRALVGSSGKVLCVTGPLNAVTAMQRLDGLKEILAGDFSLTELNADWTSERARMAVESWAANLTSDSELPACSWPTTTRWRWACARPCATLPRKKISRWRRVHHGLRRIANLRPAPGARGPPQGDRDHAAGLGRGHRVDRAHSHQERATSCARGSARHLFPRRQASDERMKTLGGFPNSARPPRPRCCSASRDLTCNLLWFNILH